MTVTISSYQRRRPLHRLLASLRKEVDADGADVDGVEVLVVLDGSSDGSVEMVRALPYPVPLRAIWQPNRGLAAARNVGLEAAAGEIVWFLDDDLELAPGVLARHRRSHEEGRSHVLMGPCVVPQDAKTVAFIRDFYATQHQTLAGEGKVRRFDHFSAANTSAPKDVLTAVGGFDERIVGYGMEDYELGYRLLAADVPIDFDAEAVAWHHQVRTIRQLCTTKVDEGRNLVRMTQLHPDTFDDLFPDDAPGSAARFLAKRGWRSAAAFRRFGRLSAVAAQAEAWATRGQRKRWFYRAILASTVAGAAEIDVEGRCVARLLGKPEERRT